MRSIRGPVQQSVAVPLGRAPGSWPIHRAAPILVVPASPRRRHPSPGRAGPDSADRRMQQPHRRYSSGLDALEATLRRDLEFLELPGKPWVPPRETVEGRPVADVAVIGAGMCGLAAAAALRLLGIDRMRVLD